MAILATLTLALMSVLVTWSFFRRAPLTLGRILVGLGFLETLWFAVLLAQQSMRFWHNPLAVLRALLPLLVLDSVALFARIARPSTPGTRFGMLFLAWILLRILIPATIYLAFRPGA